MKNKQKTVWVAVGHTSAHAAQLSRNSMSAVRVSVPGMEIKRRRRGMTARARRRKTEKRRVKGGARVHGRKSIFGWGVAEALHTTTQTVATQLMPSYSQLYMCVHHHGKSWPYRCCTDNGRTSPDAAQHVGPPSPYPLLFLA